MNGLEKSNETMIYWYIWVNHRFIAFKMEEI